jgi:hypothetical protein
MRTPTPPASPSSASIHSRTSPARVRRHRRGHPTAATSRSCGTTRAATSTMCGSWKPGLPTRSPSASPACPAGAGPPSIRPTPTRRHSPGRLWSVTAAWTHSPGTPMTAPSSSASAGTSGRWSPVPRPPGSRGPVRSRASPPTRRLATSSPSSATATSGYFPWEPPATKRSGSLTWPVPTSVSPDTGGPPTGHASSSWSAT